MGFHIPDFIPAKSSQLDFQMDFHWISGGDAWDDASAATEVGELSGAAKDSGEGKA